MKDNKVLITFYAVLIITSFIIQFYVQSRINSKYQDLYYQYQILEELQRQDILLEKQILYYLEHLDSIPPYPTKACCSDVSSAGSVSGYSSC